MFFDARQAKLLKPGDTLLVNGCPGLRLVASQSRKTWTYRYKDLNGKLKQISLGQWPAMGLADAITSWNQTKDQKAGGIDPVAARKQAGNSKATPSSANTVHGLLELFAGHLESQRKADSALAARKALMRLMEEEPVFAMTAPHAVTRSQAYDILDSRRDIPMATKKLRALLGQAWDWGMDAGKIQSESMNWWRILLKGQLRTKGKLIGGEHVGFRRRVLTRAELKVLLPWSYEHMRQESLDGLLLYLYTGMRGAEIFALKKDYIVKEEDGWWITFPSHLLKMERDADTVDHRVPLESVALKIVQRRIETAWEDRLFFISRGHQNKPYQRNTFSNYIYALMPYSAKVRTRSSEGLICPVSEWTPHALRRTVRTLLSSMDCPEEVGEAFIGHKPDVMIASYNLHTYDKQKRLWGKKLAALVDSLGGLSGSAKA